MPRKNKLISFYQSENITKILISHTIFNTDAESSTEKPKTSSNYIDLTAIIYDYLESAEQDSKSIQAQINRYLPGIKRELASEDNLYSPLSLQSKAQALAADHSYLYTLITKFIAVPYYQTTPQMLTAQAIFIALQAIAAGKATFEMDIQEPINPLEYLKLQLDTNGESIRDSCLTLPLLFTPSKKLNYAAMISQFFQELQDMVCPSETSEKNKKLLQELIMTTYYFNIPSEVGNVLCYEVNQRGLEHTIAKDAEKIETFKTVLTQLKLPYHSVDTTSHGYIVQMSGDQYEKLRRLGTRKDLTKIVYKYCRYKKAAAETLAAARTLQTLIHSSDLEDSIAVVKLQETINDFTNKHKLTPDSKFKEMLTTLSERVEEIMDDMAKEYAKISRSP